MSNNNTQITRPIEMPKEIKEFLKHADKILIMFSGGKDSVAMVLQFLEWGVHPSMLELHHHLVDGKDKILFDWECTESYCKAFAKAFNIPIFLSWRKGGD